MHIKNVETDSLDIAPGSLMTLFGEKHINFITPKTTLMAEVPYAIIIKKSVERSPASVKMLIPDP